MLACCLKTPVWVQQKLTDFYSIEEDHANWPRYVTRCCYCCHKQFLATLVYNNPCQLSCRTNCFYNRIVVLKRPFLDVVITHQLSTTLQSSYRRILLPSINNILQQVTPPTHFPPVHFLLDKYLISVTCR